MCRGEFPFLSSESISAPVNTKLKSVHTSVTRTEEGGKQEQQQQKTTVRLTALNDSLRSGEPAVNGSHVEGRLPIFTL